MKKNQFICTILFSLSFALFSQEALKSIEEEYYDFLSLQGITERPYLNYRTLSDSEWNIKEEKAASYMNEKGIAIYLLGLLSRLSWSQVARNLGIHEMIAYKKVKNITYMMIKDKAFCNEIDRLVF